MRPLCRKLRAPQLADNDSSFAINHCHATCKNSAGLSSLAETGHVAISAMADHLATHKTTRSQSCDTSILQADPTQNALAKAAQSMPILHLSNYLASHTRLRYVGCEWYQSTFASSRMPRNTLESQITVITQLLFRLASYINLSIVLTYVNNLSVTDWLMLRLAVCSRIICKQDTTG